MRLRIVGLLFVLLAACLATSGGTVTGQAVKSPDTYVSIAGGDWSTLDYAWAYDVASLSVVFNLYETLIDYDGARTDRFVPKLATSVPSLQNGLLSPDGRRYTFPIRESVRFHDGTLMTAVDVAYSLQRYLLIDRDGGPSTLMLEPILGVTSTRANGQLALRFADLQRAIQVRQNTVVVSLKEPFAPFLSIIAGWSNVVSRKWATVNGDWDGTEATMARHNNPKMEATAFFEKANGTGPFRLERWDRPGRQMVLVRNDDYWRPPARLARVVLRRIDEVATRILMLKGGDADVITISRRELPQIEGDPGIRIIDDLPLLVTDDVIFFLFDIDTRGNPDTGSGQLDGNGIPSNFFTDVHVRRGFAYAFDYSTFLLDGHRGRARIVTGVIPPMMFGYNPRQPYFTFNRDRAIAEFKEAFGGQVWERGFRFTIVIQAGGVREIEARILKDGIESLNPKFKIDIRSTTPSAARTLLSQFKRPLFLIGWAADYPDPHNFAFPFLHRDGFFPATQKFRNEEVDRLVTQALRETDRKKREALYHQIGQKYFELVPSIVTVNPVGFRAQRAWVRGWFYNPMGIGLYSLYKQ